MNKLTSNTPRTSRPSVRSPATAGAVAAKPVKYVGKTSGGHKVTFKLVGGKKIDDFETGDTGHLHPDSGWRHTHRRASSVMAEQLVPGQPNRQVPGDADAGLLLE